MRKVAVHIIAAALSAALATLSFANEARANGRFPESNAIFFAPGDTDPDLVVMRATFGLLVSRDRGKTWDWLCERSIGLAGVEDPMYVVTPNGTVLGATFQGLTISHDRMCNFAYAGGALAELVFIDVATRTPTPGTVVAFASSYAGQDDAGAVFYKSTIFETTNEGTSFTALPAAFEGTLLGSTIDLTATDPDRIYVSAQRNPGVESTAAIFTSKDHGKTFEEHAFPLVKPDERGAFIAAVDPTNADRLYVRTSGGVDKPSRLLVSDDAGKTFRVVFTGQSPLAGFALSPDGSTIWVGSVKDGLHQAKTNDFVFAKKSTVEIQCLAYAADGLWACSSEKSGFVAGLSKDEGATFEAKLHFCDIRGPLACPQGSTTHTECVLGGTADNAFAPWPPQRSVLGCGGGEELDGSSDGSTSPDGGSGAAPDDPGGTCGCSLPGTSAAAPLGLLAAFAATFAAIRRRRR